ncbi:hypothetical protein [Nannocystis pusilla]|uniref:Uncharacterized protein n=1 Tax=Nannocystis pusilla TaxID=889268 RepID=A0ABS7TMC9_9BACT|nr:hypothetical protein [Nannocystis pusilla]MBZ5709377.1 hypothetical protein [Nannocystis pusilla]
MNWGFQQFKVTLEESESGETVVIEQSSDGRVSCERGKQSKTERAANQPPRAAKNKSEALIQAPAKPAAEKRRDREAQASEDKSRAKAAAKKLRASPKAGSRSGGRGTSLEWTPVKDHDYDGFAAPSAAGQFKALIAKDTQWALFYELKGTWPQHIGCFRKVEMAKKRAQELHDAGWPESEFGPVTAGQVARACPAPLRERVRDEEIQAAPKPSKPAPKTEEKPAAPKPEPEGPSKAAQDKELMGSFSSELDAVLDEDEDD